MTALPSLHVLVAEAAARTQYSGFGSEGLPVWAWPDSELLTALARVLDGAHTGLVNDSGDVALTSRLYTGEQAVNSSLVVAPIYLTESDVGDEADVRALGHYGERIKASGIRVAFRKGFAEGVEWHQKISGGGPDRALVESLREAVNVAVFPQRTADQVAGFDA